MESPENPEKPSSRAAGAAPRGRPRDPERSKAIIEAARSLLEEGGWPAMTFEAIAEHAGVGRPTIYRRWPTKGHLAAELLRSAMERVVLPDTGSLHGDLAALAATFARSLARLEEQGLHPGVLAEMTLDVSIARFLRRELLVAGREEMSVIVQRAIAAGSARPDLDPGSVIDALSALVVYHHSIVHDELDDELLARIVDLLVRGCTCAEREASPPSSHASPV